MDIIVDIAMVHLVVVVDTINILNMDMDMDTEEITIVGPLY